MQCNREHSVAFITFGDLAVWQYFWVIDRVSYGMGYGRIFMANKKEINRNNNNKTIQNNNNNNSLLCLVVAFFFNFIRSPHSVLSIIPFYHFFDEFSILMFQMNNSPMTLWLWFCKWMNGNAPAFLSFLSSSTSLFIHTVQCTCIIYILHQGPWSGSFVVTAWVYVDCE